jgi:hypothetical protein
MDTTILENKSKELKQFMAKYKTQNMLGHLSFLMTCISNGAASNELAKLTSPMRQLYYLAGLLLSVKSDGSEKINYTDEDWEYIVEILKDIDIEHVKLFYPDEEENVSDEWKRRTMIAMPTFLSYFNLGPLNYEEQVIEEIMGVYTPMDDIIGKACNLCTKDFLLFYENLDSWCQYNFDSFSNPNLTPLRDNWIDYSELNIGVIDEAPAEFNQLMESNKATFIFVADPGIKYRFKPSDLAKNGLSLEQVNTILSFLYCERGDSNFLYYTSSNPLISKPIVKLENGMYQVFEEKRVLHAIQSVLESICKADENSKSRLSHHKGNYLENRIVELFSNFFGTKVEIFKGYYLDDCKQDVLLFWNGYMFVIEAKAYTNKEPFRDTDRAFNRIKQDFDRSIGYAYKQCKRVESKMKSGIPFEIKNKKGDVLKTISPEDYDGNDFYLIVNQESFGQIQVDLSSFLVIEEGYNYPWAVRFDDLEVFILTLMARKMRPSFFIDFLVMREFLHGHVISSDEGEICGAYITGDLTDEIAESNDIITFNPHSADIFDIQYRKGMGFKNEKYLKQKRDGSTIFW